MLRMRDSSDTNRLSGSVSDIIEFDDVIHKVQQITTWSQSNWSIEECQFYLMIEEVYYAFFHNNTQFNQWMVYWNTLCRAIDVKSRIVSDESLCYTYEHQRSIQRNKVGCRTLDHLQFYSEGMKGPTYGLKLTQLSCVGLEANPADLARILVFFTGMSQFLSDFF